MLPASLRFFGPRRQDYLPGLLDHYRPVARGMALLNEALKHVLEKRPDKGFRVLVSETDILEAEADKASSAAYDAEQEAVANARKRLKPST